MRSAEKALSAEKGFFAFLHENELYILLYIDKAFV